MRLPAVATPWGWCLSGGPQMTSGDFEPETVDCVRDLLGECDVLINIGANVGFFCCHALEMGKTVIAIEPAERNLRFLLRNIRQKSGWPERTEIWPLAVGSRPGVAKLWGWATGASLIQGWAGQPGGYFQEVPVTTLDRLLANRIKGLRAVILIDVEGCELGVLQGATEVLAMDPRPVWIIEVAGSMHQPRGRAHNPHFHAVFKLMNRHGYQTSLPATFRTQDPQGPSSLQEMFKRKTGGNYVFYDLSRRRKKMVTHPQQKRRLTKESRGHVVSASSQG